MLCCVVRAARVVSDAVTLIRQINLTTVLHNLHKQRLACINCVGNAKVLLEQLGGPLRRTVIGILIGLVFVATRRVEEPAHDPHVARHVSE